jgi:hypothetical protein
MTASLLDKRDELIDKLRGTPGFVSVGFAKKDDEVVLLVAVDDSFHGTIPEAFEGMEVIVEDLGEAQVEYNARASA